MTNTTNFFSFLIPMFVSFALSSCAQYQVSTTRSPDYEGHIERLSIWSSVGEIDLLGHKRGLESVAFTDRFDAALKSNFRNEGVTAEVHNFNPTDHIQNQFEPSEQALHPDARLLIQPTRYQTLTTSRGIMISGLWLDLRLMEVPSNRQVWHASVFLDPGLDLTVWFDTGADKLSKQIIDALKKDKLI